ncbi:MAG: alpha/beta fold hydrolase [Bacillota bacterium]
MPSPKKHDLVLLHGFTNRHKWSDQFLNVCLKHWGSGHVFVLYLNKHNDMYFKDPGEGMVTFIGKNDLSAGCDYISEQAGYMDEKINILQRDYGMSRQFYIIGHSMGGLIARYYIYHHPDTVAGLVTLGTPHHGSPMARDFNWFGWVIKAKKGMDNLVPKWVDSEFNPRYPVTGLRLYEGGKVYTVRGSSRGRPWDWGWGGELLLGYYCMRLLYGGENDGLVTNDSSLIDGAEHIADLPGYSHIDLVRKPEVAEICCRAFANA